MQDQQSNIFDFLEDEEEAKTLEEEIKEELENENVKICSSLKEFEERYKINLRLYFSDFGYKHLERLIKYYSNIGIKGQTAYNLIFNEIIGRLSYTNINSLYKYKTLEDYLNNDIDIFNTMLKTSTARNEQRQQQIEAILFAHGLKSLEEIEDFDELLKEADRSLDLLIENDATISGFEIDKAQVRKFTQNKTSLLYAIWLYQTILETNNTLDIVKPLLYKNIKKRDYYLANQQLVKDYETIINSINIDVAVNGAIQDSFRTMQTTFSKASKKEIESYNELQSKLTEAKANKSKKEIKKLQKVLDTKYKYFFYSNVRQQLYRTNGKNKVKITCNNAIKINGKSEEYASIDITRNNLLDKDDFCFLLVPTFIDYKIHGQETPIMEMLDNETLNYFCNAIAKYSLRASKNEAEITNYNIMFDDKELDGIITRVNTIKEKRRLEKAYINALSNYQIFIRFSKLGQNPFKDVFCHAIYEDGTTEPLNEKIIGLRLNEKLINYWKPSSFDVIKLVNLSNNAKNIKHKLDADTSTSGKDTIEYKQDTIIEITDFDTKEERKRKKLKDNTAENIQSVINELIEADQIENGQIEENKVKLTNKKQLISNKIEEAKTSQD